MMAQKQRMSRWKTFVQLIYTEKLVNKSQNEMSNNKTQKQRNKQHAMPSTCGLAK